MLPSVKSDLSEIPKPVANRYLLENCLSLFRYNEWLWPLFWRPLWATVSGLTELWFGTPLSAEVGSQEIGSGVLH